MNKVIQYLHLNHIGVLELLFAFTPMLSGYNLLGLPLSLFMWIVLVVVAFLRRRGKNYEWFRSVFILFLYIAIHDLVLVVVADKNVFGYLSTLLYLISILYISPVLNIDKFRGSLNLVSLVALIGLLYQSSLIFMGQEVRPLDIPFLSMSESRLEGFSLRPSSFFMEPAAYTAFMFVPMTLSLIYRQYIWFGALVFGVFLTGSTTGLLSSFIMIGVYMFSQRLKKRYILLILLMGGGMVYSLQNFAIFKVGVDKLQEVDIETNMRLAQGPYVVSTMNSNEFILGAYCSDPYDYCLKRASKVTFYTDSVFMSTFWYLILCYGIVGLFLYLKVYWKLWRQSRLVLPLIVVLLVLLFSSSYSLGVVYAYLTISLLVICYNKNYLEN